MNAEASRCLLCKKPFCSLKGCPVQTPVPEAVALYRAGEMDQAGELLFGNNPFSAVTCLVCDWKKFCYGHCVLNAKQVPVRWYEIEQEISGAYLFKHRLERKSNELEGKRIAVVGAGPAGIAAAIWLFQAGADVTLFDANPRLGGVLRYGIPAFRLDKCLVDAYEKMLDVEGITLRLGEKVTSAKDLAAAYDAVIVCAGAEKPATLRIPGEETAIQALDFLKDPGAFSLGKKAVVIGGGNVAMDACRTAARMGVETWVYYRKTFENMPANPMEVEEARQDGVQFAVFEAPVEVKEGGVVFRKCENVVPEGGGRVVTRIIDGTDHFVPCDSLITAISEKPEFALLQGASFGADGWPLVAENGLVEGLERVYLAGDYRLGAATVVEAVASVKTVLNSLLFEAK